MEIENGSIPSAFLLRLKFGFILLPRNNNFSKCDHPLLLTFHTVPGPFHHNFTITNLFQLSMYLPVRIFTINWEIECFC